jgi:phosphoglycerate kinase
MAKRGIRNVDWAGKRALVRVDFNVPFGVGSAGAQTSRISDDVRIREALPTIEYLLTNGAGVVLCTHLGRPGGERKPELELAPIAERLSELLGSPVTYVHEAVGQQASALAKALGPGEVMLLENVRFWPEEEANDSAFAQSLAGLADVYVNDAFGTSHRAHATTEGVAHYIPAVAGLLMEKEVTFLGKVLTDPERPLAALLGGAKVSDKLKVLERLVDCADALFVGGGMAATFLKAQGFGVGTSLLEADLVDFCGDMLKRSEQAGVSLNLPTDVVVADRFDSEAKTQTVKVDSVPDDWMILDIGPVSAAAYAQQLSAMGTVVWNGPMGVFEMPPFDAGTRTVAGVLADSAAVTVIGGGSTAEAIAHLGLAEKMTHVSTGGGASLEFLEGKELPGIAALDDA